MWDLKRTAENSSVKMLMLMIEREDQSLFLGFIALPPIGFMPLVRWNYNPAKSRSDRSTKRGDSTDLGVLGLRSYSFLGSTQRNCVCFIGQRKNVKVILMCRLLRGQALLLGSKSIIQTIAGKAC